MHMLTHTESSRTNLVRIDAVTPLAYLLHSAGGKSPNLCKNLSIALSRLAKDAQGLRRLRELGGIELLYSLGPKMLQRAAGANAESS